MKRVSRTVVIAIAAVIAVSMLLPAHAVTKRPVYVCTNMKVKLYDDELGTIPITQKYYYKKNGLLKKETSGIEGLAVTTYSFKYNKRSQIKSSLCTMEALVGETPSEREAKYSYTKKGHIKTVTVFTARGKQKSKTRYIRNSKDYCTAERLYNSNGKLKETTKYKLGSRGRILRSETYNAKGKMITRDKYQWKGSKCTVRSYNAKGRQTSTAIIRYEHGRMVSAILYDGAEKKKKISEAKLSYKKVWTSKYSVVRKQQDDLERIGQ